MKINRNTRIMSKINNKCTDFYEKVCLVRLLEVIRTEFKGHVTSENKLSTVMKNRYGWGNKTTRKRLDELETLGLLSLNRSGKNRWTKEYRLCEA